MKNLKSRMSNIELLRIFSMLGVLIVHADFGALGWPTREELLNVPVYTVIRIFIEAFAIVAVNVFVLISGWFGINFRWSSLAKLLFQCAFFFFGIYIIGYLCGFIQIGLAKGFYKCLMLSDNAWFVKSYLGMFIFAPVMNSFIENYSRKHVKTFLICFFIFQSIYGWLSNGAAFILDGYSTFSFMGLYILARYVQIYKPVWSLWNIKRDLLVYFTFSICTALFITLLTYSEKYNFLSYVFTKYSSILIIFAALFILLAFSKLSFNNKIINWVASSCFAVYLFHFILFPQFISPLVRYIAKEYNGFMMLLLILILLICFYITAVLIDKIRIFIWNSVFVKYFVKYDTNKG